MDTKCTVLAYVPFVKHGGYLNGQKSQKMGGLRGQSNEDSVY